MKEISGDIIKEFKTGGYDILAHGCNCFHKQKSGVAGSLVKEFPIAEWKDLETPYKDRNKLGNYYMAETDFGLILGIYTQYTYGYDHTDRFEYESFRKALKNINSDFVGCKIIFPLIGAGLAGGDWTRIKGIIADELKKLQVTICHFNR